MTSTVERQKKIVEILTLLHEGGSFEAAKQLFDKYFDGVDVSEITRAEKSLLQSGLSPSDIQKLCNVHAAVFKGSINEIHHSTKEHMQVGHPVHTLLLENQVISSLVFDEIVWVFQKMEQGDWSYRDRLIEALTELQMISKHYEKKETLIFSYMEKYGITAPPKVMWGVDDSIRELIKDTLNYVKNEKAVINQLREKIEKLKNEINEMIFKEEEIMIPMILDVFTLEDWEQIASDSEEIGFSFISVPLKWTASEQAKKQEMQQEPKRLEIIQQMQDKTSEIAKTHRKEVSKKEQTEDVYAWKKQLSESTVVFPTGSLSIEEMSAIFQVLPVDLTFVDQNDRVRFFSEGKSRVFPRTTSVIGREVINCHPPKSMHIVQQILDDFRANRRENAEFWIDMQGKKIYIRYFALKNEANDYLGCLEVTQDITEIQKITGQNRLLDTNNKEY